MAGQSETNEPEQLKLKEQPLMTVRELADYLSITESTVYKMVNRQEIPSVRLGQNGRTLRFRREEIEAWLRNRRKPAMQGCDN
jgi:excisionase family DNA binding protein